MKKRKAARHVERAMLFLAAAERLLDNTPERDTTEEECDARDMVRETRKELRRMLRKLRGRRRQRPQRRERGLPPGSE